MVYADFVNSFRFAINIPTYEPDYIATEIIIFIFPRMH